MSGPQPPDGHTPSPTLSPAIVVAGIRAGQDTLDHEPALLIAAARLPPARARWQGSDATKPQ